MFPSTTASWDMRISPVLSHLFSLFRLYTHILISKSLSLALTSGHILMLSRLKYMHISKELMLFHLPLYSSSSSSYLKLWHSHVPGHSSQALGVILNSSFCASTNGICLTFQCHQSVLSLVDFTSWTFLKYSFNWPLSCTCWSPHHLWHSFIQQPTSSFPCHYSFSSSSP